MPRPPLTLPVEQPGGERRERHAPSAAASEAIVLREDDNLPYLG